MIVRPGVRRDVQSLVAMGDRMHQESTFAFLPFDREKVCRFVAQLLDDPENHCLFVAEQDLRVVGMLAGCVVDYFFCEQRVACDLALFVDHEWRGTRAAPKLIRQFQHWAAARNAVEVCLAVSANSQPDAVGRLYQRLGFARVGLVYKMRL